MKKLKKEYKRAIILVLAIIIIVIIIKVIQGIDPTKSELKKKGYSKEEIATITEKLEKDKIELILNRDYNEFLDDITNEEYFIPNNLEKYLDFTKDEKDLKKIISKVNVGANKDWYTDTVETKMDNEYAILVNKFHYLNKDFALNDLVSISDWYAYAGHKTRSEVYSSYVDMWKAAKQEDLTILVTSSIRTYEEQDKEYKKYGDKLASRPGFSEHQTGLALDVSTYDTQGEQFKDTKEYAWLQENAHKYGFILRYPEGKEDITGYSYESWHYRYLGTTLATKVYNSGLTYDEYYAYFCEYKGEC